MIEKLSIYKDAYLLTNKIYRAMPQMEKMHRHSIGPKILDSSLDMFKWITIANKTKGTRHSKCKKCIIEYNRRRNSNKIV